MSALMNPQSCFLSGVWGSLRGSAHCGFHRWRGDYGGKKQLWFPSNYVEEMVSPAALEPEREVRPGPYWWEGIPVSTAHAATNDSHLTRVLELEGVGPEKCTVRQPELGCTS